MSPTVAVMTAPVTFTPTSDTMDRREYGITKTKKATSTGGGRAWSEEEEAYLIQTRMQKMPYKHIAAHLKKTELACRLHFHQLSHGSNRRKRTTSLSSHGSNQSPPIHGAVVSPVREIDAAPSRSVSPAGSTYSYSSTSPNAIQLPSIMSATSSANTSPRLPAILPKPAAMSLDLPALSASASRSTSPAPSHTYTSSLHPHSATSGYRSAPTSSRRSLRLDCSALPPPPTSAATPAPFSSSQPVDMSRLSAVYNAHRASFWASVAADYGNGVSPTVLEQAWRGGNTQTPITPVGSPDEQVYALPQLKADKTRISAILGIDANPRSPREREMVRKLEKERCSLGMVGA
ncbi:hypothetical protein SMACR_02038 [Sordaria macrospora]|uniref:WGS project CABT00000000 data, contig 2.18 n=2 Tax=Sordaria macrospora TaxID=5147 RepID=F7W0S8_SORMK|nr:uncharacterized protein SMAC_02038 [Sordaria macrospora k-hell]KAA8632964.1 hypothetical protein SMACR_02038 [Sordaria macrospora]WPJ63883.1 hypothetical protein SMAC4_02038 [Sordaria macrospora]CCC11380.1 unnamed protein product [Sordaria macrospora k-hell]